MNIKEYFCILYKFFVFLFLVFIVFFILVMPRDTIYPETYSDDVIFVIRSTSFLEVIVSILYGIANKNSKNKLFVIGFLILANILTFSKYVSTYIIL